MGVGKLKPNWGGIPKKAYSTIKERSPLYDTTHWRAARELVRARAYNLCQMCGTETGLTRGDYAVDHIVPINQKGAAYDPENLQLLCASCHAKKSQKDGNRDDK